MHDWILQRKEFGLGNWTMLTPAIQKFYQIRDYKPVPVFFETKIVEKLYAGWECIEILREKPESPPFCTTDPLSVVRDDPNFQLVPDYYLQWANLLSFSKKADAICPREYCPPFPKSEDLPDDYVVVMRGANHDQPKRWKELKNPGHNTYREIISRINLPIVFIGNNQDWEEYIRPVVETMDSEQPFQLILNNIEDSAMAVQHARYVVTNDTGMFHVAGCYDVPIFCLWKDTAFIKNTSSSPFVTYSHKGNWISDFESWVEKFDK